MSLQIFDSQGSLVHEQFDFITRGEEKVIRLSASVFQTSGVYQLVVQSEDAVVTEKLLFYR